MRPTYIRVKRVHARSEGPNPSGPVSMLSSLKMKVEKEKFDAAFKAILKSKPVPREKIKTKGKRGPKTPIFPPSNSDK